MVGESFYEIKETEDELIIYSDGAFLTGIHLNMEFKDVKQVVKKLCDIINYLDSERTKLMFQNEEFE